jgi:hypothetical protein
MLCNTEIEMRILTFNTQATSAIHGRNGAKLRMDVKDGTLMVRPTDRKAGPHVLSELQTKGKNGVQVEITDKQLEKLGAAGILGATAQFGLRADKYGWFALTTGEASADDKLAVEGAEVTVAEKSE